jgi:hypothetical protein
VLFSAAIVWARIRVGTNEIGCGCFGGARKRDYRLLLARNISLAAVAVVAVWSGGRADLSADLVGEPNAVPWVLVMVAAVGCFWVVWQVSRRVRHEGRPRVAATRAVPGSGGTVERRGG